MSVEIITADIFPTVDSINNAYENLKDRIDTQAQASINITNITRQTNNTTYDYTITIHNTGSITLPTASLTILLNGTKEPYTTTQTYLYPDTTTTLTVLNIPGPSSKRIKIITKNGIADYHTYTPT
jgi:archaellum component FlaF (FlaF/FlaG flagellin family)